MANFFDTLSRFSFIYKEPPKQTSLKDYVDQIKKEMSDEENNVEFKISENDFLTCKTCEKAKQIRKCNLCYFKRKLVKSTLVSLTGYLMKKNSTERHKVIDNYADFMKFYDKIEDITHFDDDKIIAQMERDGFRTPNPHTNALLGIYILSYR